MGESAAWKIRLTRELSGAERLAVLGIGNVLKGDDAVGVRTVEILRRSLGPRPGPKILLLAAHEAPENFTGKIRAFRPAATLLIDAVSFGFPPGTVSVIDASSLPDDDISTHRISLSALSGFLGATVGCRVLMIGIEPQEFTGGQPLTPAVEKAALAIARHLARLAGRRLRSSSASKHKYS